MWAGLQVAFIGALGLAFILTGVLQLYRSKIVWTPRRLPSPFYWLFAVEGVGVLARRSLDRRRGLPRMEVPTPAIRKTSTCTTLPLLQASPALI